MYRMGKNEINGWDMMGIEGNTMKTEMKRIGRN